MHARLLWWKCLAFFPLIPTVTIRHLVVRYYHLSTRPCIGQLLLYRIALLHLKNVTATRPRYILHSSNTSRWYFQKLAWSSDVPFSSSSGSNMLHFRSKLTSLKNKIRNVVFWSSKENVSDKLKIEESYHQAAAGRWIFLMSALRSQSQEASNTFYFR